MSPDEIPEVVLFLSCDTSEHPYELACTTEYALPNWEGPRINTNGKSTAACGVRYRFNSNTLDLRPARSPDWFLSAVLDSLEPVREWIARDGVTGRRTPSLRFSIPVRSPNIRLRQQLLARIASFGLGLEISTDLVRLTPTKEDTERLATLAREAGFTEVSFTSCERPDW